MKKEDKTNAALAFDSQLRATARVEHHLIGDEYQDYMNQLRDVLADMAKDLQERKVAQPGFEYMGSFSVHVYASEGLKGTFEFVPVSNPHKCFYKLAEAAAKKLAGDIQQMFTGKVQKYRSGFPSGS